MKSPRGLVWAVFPCCGFPCGSHFSSGVAVTPSPRVGPHGPYLEAGWLISLITCLLHQSRGLKGIAFPAGDPGHARAIPSPQCVPIPSHTCPCCAHYSHFWNTECIAYKFVAMVEQLRKKKAQKPGFYTHIVCNISVSSIASAEPIVISSNQRITPFHHHKVLHFLSVSVPIITALLSVDC